MAGPVQVKSIRASSVGQRWPLASTTSTSRKATSLASAKKPVGPVVGVSLSATGGPAVVRVWSMTGLPAFEPTAFRVPGAKATEGKLKIQRLSGLALTPRDLPLRKSSTDWVLAMT